MRTEGERFRIATAEDCDELLRLWAHLFDVDDPVGEPWHGPAKEWFLGSVDDHARARFPLIERDGTIVATAIGTLEVGVPNPHCPRGRAVRLANVFTLPSFRREGYGAWLTRDVLEWARSIDADRVDLSASEQGLSMYAGLGFTHAAAPRMKLML